MAKTFKVLVETRVEEVYYVEAESASEAEDTFDDFPMDRSECLEILDVHAEIEYEDEDE